jgi:hypothetical protein
MTERREWIVVPQPVLAPGGVRAIDVKGSESRESIPLQSRTKGGDRRGGRSDRNGGARIATANSTIHGPGGT